MCVCVFELVSFVFEIDFVFAVLSDMCFVLLFCLFCSVLCCSVVSCVALLYFFLRCCALCFVMVWLSILCACAFLKLI